MGGEKSGKKRVGKPRLGPQYRFTFSIYAHGYKKGKKHNMDVTGYMFTFSDKPNQVGIRDLVDRVKDIASRFDERGYFGVTYKVGEEAFEPVDLEEVRGVGFYYPIITINDERVEKADVRRGLWRILFSVVRGLFE